MNLCILSGKVVNEIDLKFIYNKAKKNLGKKHISIVQVMLELEKKQIVLLHAYDEMADLICRNVHKEDYIVIQGKVRDNYVKVEHCSFYNANQI